MPDLSFDNWVFFLLLINILLENNLTKNVYAPAGPLWMAGA